MLSEDLAAAGEPDVGRGLLGMHRNHVRNRLAEHRNNPRILAKYRWLAACHNRFCRFALSGEELKEMLIPVGGEG